MDVENRLLNFFKLIKKFDECLKFQIVEIGANPYGKFNERFHKLLDYFPNSKIYAFDVDKNECEKFGYCFDTTQFYPSIYFYFNSILFFFYFIFIFLLFYFYFYFLYFLLFLF